MITPSFSLTATERILPSLALNFMGASLDARISLTRTTDATNPATYINSSGLVTAATNNEARFDYNPSTLALNGLLIEESRTNICQYSENLANTVYWSSGDVNRTANAAVAPDGNTAAAQLTSTAVNGEVLQSVAMTSGATYTFSMWVKTDSGTTNVSFGNIAIGEYTAFTATATWQRFSVTQAAGGTTRFPKIIISANNATVFVWGAQIELGAFVTSYIPNTTTGTKTRNADVAVMTGTNFSNWWKATTGAVAVQYRTGTVSGTRPALQFDDTTANNIIALRGNTTNPELYIVDGGSAQVQIDAGTIAANTAYRLAAGWATNNCSAVINGGAVVVDGSATIPTVTQARLGSDGTNYLNGHLQTIEYYNRKPTNTTLEQLSSSAGRYSVLLPILKQVVQP